jgi:hypothetical protein
MCSVAKQGASPLNGMPMLTSVGNFRPSSPSRRHTGRSYEILPVRDKEILSIQSYTPNNIEIVLGKTVEVILGDHTDILCPGDSIYYDSNIPHRVQCHQDKVTRILAVLYTADS